MRRKNPHARLDEIMEGLATTYQTAYDRALRGRAHPGSTSQPLHDAPR